MKDNNTLDIYGLDSCELYFSAVCNLNCVYCFQPKLKEHGSLKNKEIIDWITSGRMEDDIENTFGRGIKTIALWGGEPTINLPYLTNILKRFLDRFSSLETISFSTNISKDFLSENIINFMKSLNTYLNFNSKRKISLEIQYSIDGAPEINDRNRIGSSADEILNNIFKVLDYVNNNDLKFKIIHNFKGTHDSISIARLSNIQNLENHYKYFDNFYKKCREKGYKKFPRSGEYITVVFPGNWTKEDGINFNKICKILQDPTFRKKFGSDVTFKTQIHSYLERISRNATHVLGSSRIGSWKNSLSCGALKHSLGLSPGGKLSICHHSFFFDEEARNEIKTKNLITDFEKYSGFSFLNYNNYFLNKEQASFKENPLKVLRNLKCGRDSIRSSSLRLQYAKMMIMELAKNNQIEVNLENKEEMNIIYGAILFAGCECVVNNIWETGTYSLRNPSIYRLLFNGAFNTIMENIKGNYIV